MSIFKTYTPEQFDAHFQSFLITSWSYSKVEHFARNQKSFEMSYIFGMKGRSGASTVAGSAYHEALSSFFEAYKENQVLTIVDLEHIVFKYIDEFNTNFFKLQKTTPTVADCITKALKVSNALLKNFFGEIGTYIDEIEEIIDVEVYCNEWLSVNGFDIQLPCHMKIDLVVKLKNGNIAIIDHKSKDKFSDEKELRLSIGKQAITYVLGYESKTGIDVNEVWFVENKFSQNTDKSIKQLQAFKITVDKDTRRLYEHLLYEPLKAMMEAITNPEHVYILNESDNWVDKAELYEFWMKMLVQEVTDLDVTGVNKEMVTKRLRKIRDASIGSINPRLIRDFQKNASQFIQYDLSNTNMTHEEKIIHALQTFNIKVEVPHKFNGISSNTFLLNVSAGTKISSIHTHAMDIANMLDVSSVRIPKELVMHENKSFVAVEFSKKRERNLMFNPADRKGYKIPIGHDNYGNVLFWDLENNSTPHMLVCGATGSGKSVFLTCTLAYILQAAGYEIIIMDPKYEFSSYRSMGIKVCQEIIEIEEEMALQVKEMNRLVKAGEKCKTLILFDEYAEALLQSRKGNELKVYDMVLSGVSAKGMPIMKRECVEEHKPLEDNLQSLAQKGRSVGYRIVIATQRADTKAISGNIKVNFPVAICFAVPKAVDSQVILDEPGAEKLQGFGDGLIKSPAHRDITRFQAYYKPE
jgi:S-DNA-T family DNA segregation ATPase FtsK/SpoIIIE